MRLQRSIQPPTTARPNGSVPAVKWIGRYRCRAVPEFPAPRIHRGSASNGSRRRMLSMAKGSGLHGSQTSGTWLVAIVGFAASQTLWIRSHVARRGPFRRFADKHGNLAPAVREAGLLFSFGNVAVTWYAPARPTRRYRGRPRRRRMNWRRLCRASLSPEDVQHKTLRTKA